MTTRALLTGIAIALCALVGLPAAATAAEPDTTPPTTNLLLVGDLGSKQKLFFFPNEAASAIDCRVDDQPWVSCMGAGPGHDWVTPEVWSGFHTAQVRTTDLAGNVEDPPISHSYYVRPEAPRIVAGQDTVSQGTGWTSDTTPTFRFETRDPNIGAYKCWITPSFGPPSWPEKETCGSEWSPAAPLVDGRYQMAVEAYDGLGTSATNSFSFGVDSRDPVVTLITPGRVSAGTPVKIKLDAYDENRSVEKRCLLDRKRIKCKPQVLEGLEPGTHRIFVYIRDQAGNEASAKSKFLVARN